MTCKDKAVQEAVAERNSLERRLAADKQRLQMEVDKLHQEVERKENKIKTNLSSIEELMSKLEEERSSYDIALRGKKPSPSMLSRNCFNFSLHWIRL